MLRLVRIIEAIVVIGLLGYGYYTDDVVMMALAAVGPFVAEFTFFRWHFFFSLFGIFDE